MESSILKEEIKKLKQQIHQTETLISVHKAVQNGNEVILQAPTKETLQSMYDQLFTLVGVQDKSKNKINPIFVCIQYFLALDSSLLLNIRKKSVKPQSQN